MNVVMLMEPEPEAAAPPMPAILPAPPAPPLRLDRLSLNALRGAVCFGIMTMHLYGSWSPRLSPAVRRVTDFLFFDCRFGAGAFLVLSGFFVAHWLRPSERLSLSIARLFARRFVRLVIPFWTALAVLCLWLHAAGRPGAPSVLQAAAEFLFVAPYLDVPHVSLKFWFLATMIQFYLLVFAGFWVVRRAALAAAIPAYHAVAARCLDMVLFTFGALQFFDHLSGGALLPEVLGGSNGMLLAVGYFLYRALVQGEGEPYAISMVIFLLCPPWFASADRVVSLLVFVAALIYLLRGGSFGASLPVQALAWIGVRSYSLYLVHGNIGKRVLPLPDIDGPLEAVGLFVLSLAFSLALGYLFHRFIELPAAALARKITYR